MKQKLIYLNTPPNQTELKLILGDIVYNYYLEVLECIVNNFNPDTEIWDFAGRQGKYFQGFRNERSKTLIDLYFIESDNLISKKNSGKLNLRLTLNKRTIKKVINIKEVFHDEVKNSLDHSLNMRGDLGSFYLQSFVNSKTFSDVLKLIKVIS